MAGLDGRIVLVTGSARGIGRAIAERVAECGADVALADVRGDALADVAARIERLGRRALALEVDVTSKADVDAMVEEAVGSYGRIDVAFSNAGVIEVHEFLDLPEADWDRILGVNLKGVFLCGQAVARQMVAQGSGRIVNTASIAARIGIADMAAYAASKAGVMSLTRSMALALGPKGVTVNALAPGIVETDMWSKIDDQRAALRGQTAGEPTRERVGLVPLGRAAGVGDVASLAAFLAGDEAGYINGQTINVDGGAVPS